jgi:hypothetical protein
MYATPHTGLQYCPKWEFDFYILDPSDPALRRRHSRVLWILVASFRVTVFPQEQRATGGAL